MNEENKKEHRPVEAEDKKVEEELEVPETEPPKQPFSFKKDGKIKPPRGQFKDARKRMEQEQILALIAEGATFTHAAEMVGRSLSTADRWRNEEEWFQQDILKAMAAFKLTHIRNIARHSEMDWKASKFLLERKFPNEFGEKVFQQVEQVGQKEDSFASQLLKQLLPASVVPAVNIPSVPATPATPINPEWVDHIDELQVDTEDSINDYEEEQLNDYDSQSDIGDDEYEEE